MSQNTVNYGKSSIQKKYSMLVSVQNSQTKFMHVIIVLVALFTFRFKNAKEETEVITLWWQLCESAVLFRQLSWKYSCRSSFSFFCSNKSLCYLFMDICLTEVLPPQKYIMYEISIDCLSSVVYWEFFVESSTNVNWKMCCHRLTSLTSINLNCTRK